MTSGGGTGNQKERPATRSRHRAMTASADRRRPIGQHSTRAGRRGQPIYTGSGRIAGIVYGPVLRRVCTSKHQLTTPPAWAFDLHGLLYAEALGAQRVEVEVSDTGAVYEVELSELWRRGFKFDRGFGQQVALEVKWWRIKRPAGGQGRLI